MATRSISQRVQSIVTRQPVVPQARSASVSTNWWQQYALSLGYRNDRSGAGGSSDLTRGASFQGAYLDRITLESIYATSWAARKFIDIPIADSFVRWRQFHDNADQMEEAENKHEVKERLTTTLRNARLIGSGMIAVLTKDGPTESELDIDTLAEGDLLNLLVLDKWDANVKQYYSDPFDPKFRKPEIYDVHLGMEAKSVQMDIHESRIIRIDGVEPPGKWRWMHRDEWGISNLEAVLPVIFQNAALANSISHLSEEASVTIMNMRDFREALAGIVDDEDKADWLDVLTTNLGIKSNYRTVVMDKDDEINRLAVTFTGLPEIMDRFARLLAAAADIPATRFWGQSPLGMNATGEGDMINYAMTVAAYQTQKIDPALQILDKVLAKDAGLAEPPTYEWRSLIDLSDRDSARISEIKANVVTRLVAEGITDEKEARHILSGDTMIGELSEELPESLLAPDPMDMPMMPPPGIGGNGNGNGQNGSAPAEEEADARR